MVARCFSGIASQRVQSTGTNATASQTRPACRKLIPRIRHPEDVGRWRGERKKEERWWSREGREREREEERERATKTNQKETYQNSIPNEESTPDSAIAIIKAGSRRKKAAKWRTAHRGTLDQRACLVVVSGPVFLDSLVDLVPVGLGLFVVLFALNLRDWQWGG